MPLFSQEFLSQRTKNATLASWRQVKTSASNVARRGHNMYKFWVKKNWTYKLNEEVFEEVLHRGAFLDENEAFIRTRRLFVRRFGQKLKMDFFPPASSFGLLSPSSNAIKTSRKLWNEKFETENLCKPFVMANQPEPLFQFFVYSISPSFGLLQ